MTGSARLLVSPVALLLVAGAAACTGGSSGGKTASPFADCAALTAVPPSAAAPSAVPSSAVPRSAGPPSAGPASSVRPSAGAGATELPDLKLSCFTGGQQVRLSQLRGPAVLNLWASWCGPCRTELPAMQRLADATTGRLHVVGIDSGDDRSAAAEFAAEKKVTLPTLSDPDKTLSAALGRTAIPITVFLDAAGKPHVYDRMPPDYAQLAELVRANTGVTVTS